MTHHVVRRSRALGPVRMAAALAAAMIAGEASATLLISSTTETSFAYGFTYASVQESGGGDVNSVFLPSPPNGSPGQLSQISLDTVSTVSGDSFYFLHTLWCYGVCTVTATTTTTVSIFNDSDSTVSGMRFDSVITPGHLAFVGADSASYASFAFIVNENSSDINQNRLLNHTGIAGQTDFNVNTFGGDSYNGITSQDDGSVRYMDWSATNIAFDLSPIAPHATTELRYYTYTIITANTVCEVIDDCSGVQVSFGDPRTTGGGVNNLSFFGMPGLSALGSGPGGESVIGRAFDPYGVGFAVVPNTTPLPPTPPVLRPPVYTSNFPAVSPVTGVPEPASWALMIGGFALAGGLLRHRPARWHVA